MEKINHTFKVYDNFIEITTSEPIKSDSIYEIKIKSVKSVGGRKSIDNLDIKVHTKLTPSYCSIEAVRSMIEGYVEDHKIMYYIREASRFAEYIKKEEYGYHDVPFEVVQYVKHKAAYDSLLKFYIDKCSESGTKGTLGEISFENTGSDKLPKSILDDLKAEVDKWEEHLRGYGFEGRAKPASAVKSMKSDRNASLKLYGTNQAKYGTHLTGYSRGVSRK